MTSDQNGLRASGAWLAAGSLLLALALMFHGPLHPDLEVQMTHIGESPGRWTAVHWAAAAACTSFAISAVLMLVSRSRLTGTRASMSAWAVILVGALWTLMTAVTEVTVIADLAAAEDLVQFRPWWSFAQGFGNGFSMLALAAAVIAWREYLAPERLVPAWSAAAGAGAGVASFGGWALGVWLGIGPANLVWLVASGAMCAWLAWLGLALAGTPPAR